MTKRFFTKRQKRILKVFSGNYCQKCGKVLKGKFHADHKIPFSKGGKTILKNAQALCNECNLKKGNKLDVRA
jgi:5-methylcytosine-specific restriction endonuclease McrA|tara:strand:+ start:294 stop:509 length:216 start_codon:yes stop_codon:yes gene_type:complete